MSVTMNSGVLVYEHRLNSRKQKQSMLPVKRNELALMPRLKEFFYDARDAQRFRGATIDIFIKHIST